MKSNPAYLKPLTSAWSTRDNRSPILESKINSIAKNLFQKKDIHLNSDEKYSQVPYKSSNPELPKIAKFEECLVNPRLLKNLKKCGIITPTPIQQYSIPAFLLRKDILACSQTGSGKTVCYLFSLIAKMLIDGPPPAIYQPNSRPLAIILVPTHELANQVYEEALKLTYKTGIRVITVSGGIPIIIQKQEVYHGSDIIVATPLRLIDFAEKKLIDLSMTRYLIIDEIDMMLNSGFKPQILRVLQDIKKLERETFMCSASLPTEIETLSSLHLNDLVRIFVGKADTVNKNIQQIVHLVRFKEKFNVLFDILISRPGLKLVFVNTKVAADNLQRGLARKNINCLSLHGGKSKSERSNTMMLFKKEKVSALIATNLASRGLDLPNISFVILYDIPINKQIYIHAIGRTGRLEKNGVAELLIVDKPCGIYSEIVKVMENSSQYIPEWFRDLANGLNHFNESLYYVYNQNAILNKEKYKQQMFRNGEDLIGVEIKNANFILKQFHEFNSNLERTGNLNTKQSVREYETEILELECSKGQSFFNFFHHTATIQEEKSMIQKTIKKEKNLKKVEYTLQKVRFTSQTSSQPYSILLDNFSDNYEVHSSPDTDPWKNMNPALIDLNLEIS